MRTHPETMMKLFLLLLLLLALANPFTLAWIAEQYVVEDALVPVDVIVPLRGSSDENRARVEEAARLVRERYAPVLLVSVSGKPFYGRPQHSLIEEYLKQANFPAQRLQFCENLADSTAEEAQAIYSCLRQMGAKQVILVTSEYHTRRVRSAFQRILSGIGIVIRIRPVYNEEYWNSHWWRRRRWAKTFFRETAALAWNTVEYWGVRGRRALPASLKQAGSEDFTEPSPDEIPDDSLEESL